MSRAPTVIFLASIVILGAVVRPAAAGTATPDPVSAAWRARAKLAAKKLAGPGLDACDRGVELAFQHPEEKVSGNRRDFILAIEVDGKTMLVTYSYETQRLEAFGILALPPGWLALQKAGSKTLTVLLSSASKCALDLCTDDPTAGGPCAEKRAR